MVRAGFTMKHFLPHNLKENFSFSQSIKKGMENTEVSWAKSKQTSYSYYLNRCREMGWKILICVNPSLNTDWKPHRITPSSDVLDLWERFCFHLAQFIHEKWPGMAEFFEITNEPDVGYFDGETFVPDTKSMPKAITPFQCQLLLRRACQGIKRAVPDARIIGPGLARWNKKWIQKILSQNPGLLDGLSYHNVMGNLQDARTLKKARKLSSKNGSSSPDMIFNSEWAWWPFHDTDDLETALRVARILYLQAKGRAYASLYLGPAQPQDFKKGLGVLKFDPANPDSVKKTRTFHAFALMTSGVLGGERLQVINPIKKVKITALYKRSHELVVTLLNPSPKKWRDVCIRIEESISSNQDSSVKKYTFDENSVDSYQESQYNGLEKFDIKPKSITQFVIPFLV